MIARLVVSAIKLLIDWLSDSAFIESVCDIRNAINERCYKIGDDIQ